LKQTHLTESKLEHLFIPWPRRILYITILVGSGASTLFAVRKLYL
jgi:hypothetical protein